jgi:hypothetical protein
MNAGGESLLGQSALKTNNDLHVITNGALVGAILTIEVFAERTIVWLTARFTACE